MRRSGHDYTLIKCSRDAMIAMVWHSLLATILVSITCGFTKCTDIKRSDFPKDFIFGVASSAYQIEGGFAHGGKGPSIWDHFLELHPNLVKDNSSGELAADSYHKYPADIEVLSHLGVDFYRFSISWARIMPKGYISEINGPGLSYYNRIIDELLDRGIEPMITLYHWDLPQHLQELGGWTNPHLVDYFEDYARVVFEHFGDRVKYWITFNVYPNGYGIAADVWPPLIDHPGIANYLYTRNVILAHSRVYHLYRNQFADFGGKVGITIDGSWFEPASSSRQDQEASRRCLDLFLGLYLSPLIKGDYPESVRTRIDALSKAEGFQRSRLIPFSPEEKVAIRGTLDFVGLNLYTSCLVQDNPKADELPTSFEKDLKALVYQDANWAGSASGWLKVTPWSVRKGVKWIKEEYDNPVIFITENGFSDHGTMEDDDRINYHKEYLKELSLAIEEDQVNVKAYAVWSLMDNFEWLSGYTEKFGLYSIDFNHPLRVRVPKKSARWYKEFLQVENKGSIENRDEL